MPIKLYIITTFVGSLFRNAIFIFAGYQGSLFVDVSQVTISPEDVIISGFIVPTILVVFAIWYIRYRNQEYNKPQKGDKPTSM